MAAMAAATVTSDNDGREEMLDVCLWDVSCVSVSCESERVLSASKCKQEVRLHALSNQSYVNAELY